jgi:hypothetical protein
MAAARSEARADFGARKQKKNLPLDRAPSVIAGIVTNPARARDGEHRAALAMKPAGLTQTATRSAVAPYFIVLI